MRFFQKFQLGGGIDIAFLSTNKVRRRLVGLKGSMQDVLHICNMVCSCAWAMGLSIGAFERTGLCR